MTTQLQELPNELLINIFSFFNSTDMTKYFFSLKPFTDHLKYIINKFNLTEEAKHLKMKIPGWYILKRQTRNKEKKQIVKIDNAYTRIGKDMKKVFIYEYHYGMYSYHEGCCKFENIIELTPEEKNLLKNNEFWKLPQEFYHSDPI